MAQGRRSPLLPILLFTAVVAVCTWLVLNMLGQPFTAAYAGILGYFTLITCALHLWQEQGMDNDPKGFVRRFMAGLVMKMFLSLMVIVLLVFLLPRNTALPLAVTFAVLYLAYLGFSTARLSMLLRNTPRT